VLLAQRVLTAVEGLVEAEAVGEVSLKGLSRPMQVFDLLRLKS